MGPLQLHSVAANAIKLTIWRATASLSPGHASRQLRLVVCFMLHRTGLALLVDDRSVHNPWLVSNPPPDAQSPKIATKFSFRLITSRDSRGTGYK